MKIIVAQIGARHSYALPRMLERAGCLERLYTDACAEHGLGRWMRALWPAPLRPNRLRKLTDRTVDGVSTHKIYSTDRVLLNDLIPAAPGESAQEAYRRLGRVFSESMKSWGLGDATMVYSMFGEGRDFLRYAKEAGRLVAVDVFITPTGHRTIHKERLAFPDWETPQDVADPTGIEENVREIIDLADLLTCPSDTVVDGLSAYDNFDPAKARVVPYGNGIDYRGRVNEPERGRILFAGTAELRKGIHYYAEAAQRLSRASNTYDFRVAGNVTDRVCAQPACAALNFLGRIPRQDMVEEYMHADVFVLPSLVEGSASVVYEALAAGVPVITTRGAGSVVTHREDGLIVPERDPDALAEAIAMLVNDRARRREMATAALRKAETFTEAVWQRRLTDALRSAHQVTERALQE